MHMCQMRRSTAYTNQRSPNALRIQHQRNQILRRIMRRQIVQVGRIFVPGNERFVDVFCPDGLPGDAGASVADETIQAAATFGFHEVFEILGSFWLGDIAGMDQDFDIFPATCADGR